MIQKTRKAFTLAETIMTLFIVGLVVTAAIPVFTQKQRGTTELNTPWGYCYDYDNVKEGLCLKDSTGKLVDTPVVVGTDTPKAYPDEGDNSAKYNITVDNGAGNTATIFDVFSSPNRSVLVGGHNIKEDRSNIYITTETTYPTSAAEANVIIGDVKDPTGALEGDNNVLIGQENEYPKDGSDSLILGNKNKITGGSSNAVIIGQENTASNPSGTIKIGTKIGNATNQGLYIGSNLVELGGTYRLNIADKLLLGHDNALNIDYIELRSPTNTVQLSKNLETTTFYSTSDKRLKNIKGEYKKGLKEINQIEPVVFEYKTLKKGNRNTGVIAQDVQKVFPEAVKKMPNGYLGLNTDPIFFAMLNAMKELNTQISAEEQKQIELEEELNNLETEIKSLNECKSDSFFGKIKCFFVNLKMNIKYLISSSEVKYEKA